MKAATHKDDFRSRVDLWLKTGILVLLLLVCVLVLLPFVTALLWASVLSFSLWPLHLRLVRMLGGRGTLAALLLSLAMVMALLLPVGIVTAKLADNVSDLKAVANRLLESPPPPPAWLAKVPLLGRSATEKWQALTADKAKLREEAKKWLAPVAAALVGASFKLGSGFVQLTLSLLISFFLLRNGNSIGEHLLRAMERIAGQYGKQLLELAGGTIRGVVYGILGTALVQACMAGFGFLIAGVPGPALLAFLVFFLSAVPLGPTLICLPAALWLFHQGSNGWAIFMLIWGVAVGAIDNFVKPWLISQGSDMPIILILFGVVGGAFAFGFIGVFIGPTVLAVGYRLIIEWGRAPGTPDNQAAQEVEHLSPKAP